MCYNVFIAFGLCVVKHKDGRFFKLISPKNGPGSCYFSVKVYKFRHNFLNSQEKKSFFRHAPARGGAGHVRHQAWRRRGSSARGSPPATVAWPWMPPPQCLALRASVLGVTQRLARGREFIRLIPVVRVRPGRDASSTRSPGPRQSRGMANRSWPRLSN